MQCKWPRKYKIQIFGTPSCYLTSTGIHGGLTEQGLYEKYTPLIHDYALPKDFVDKLISYPYAVNFLTDNDITGGNSGSPVLDAQGRLIGLAFDGNKESLASDVSFTPDYNKCVCVDIRYVLWILKEYAGLDRIIKEIES